MKFDSLGDRMKDYEHRSQMSLPRRTYTIIRLDGKAFHSYTKGCKRPYDLGLMEDMDNTAKFLCEEIQGCKLAYVQSDEIQDIEVIKNCYGCALGAFEYQVEISKLAFFDSRCWTLSEADEVLNCLIWRQQDATRNSIQMTGQAYFSHKNLQGKSCDDIQEMLWSQENINWNDLPVGFKRGRCVVREAYDFLVDGNTIVRHRWSVVEPPVFTQDRDWVWNYIPQR